MFGSLWVRAQTVDAFNYVWVNCVPATFEQALHVLTLGYDMFVVFVWRACVLLFDQVIKPTNKISIINLQRAQHLLIDGKGNGLFASQTLKQQFYYYFLIKTGLCCRTGLMLTQAVTDGNQEFVEGLCLFSAGGRGKRFMM